MYVNENPWATNGPAAGGWVDAPFPREGDTYESILYELISGVYDAIYALVEEDARHAPTAPSASSLASPGLAPLDASSSGKEDTSNGDTTNLDATTIGSKDNPPALDGVTTPPPSTTPRVKGGRHRVSGVYEYRTWNPMRRVFPSIEQNRLCGKLALMSPIPGPAVASALQRKVDSSGLNRSDPLVSRACAIANTWLRESYTDSYSDGPGEAQCNCCNRTLKPFSFRIKCADCVDYDLCERCFAEGLETESHSKLHRYIPIGPQNFLLFSDQWSASEELILLEAVAKYGFGNWNEVAEWVSVVSPTDTVPVKDKDTCEKRYYDFHLNNRASSQPIWAIQNLKFKLLYDGSLGFTQALLQHKIAPQEIDSQNDGQTDGNKDGNKDTTKDINDVKSGQDARGDSGASARASKKEIDYSPIYNARGIDLVYSSSCPRPKRVKTSLPHLSQTATSQPSVGQEGMVSGDELLAGSDVILDKELGLVWEYDLMPEAYRMNDEYEMPLSTESLVTVYQATKPVGMLPPRVSISGYQYNRGDLDVEYNNDFELSICDLEIKEFDSPMEKEAKLQALDVYSAVLDDRWLRKRLYFDRSVYDIKNNNASLSKWLSNKALYVSNKSSCSESEFKVLWETLRPLWRFLYYNYSEHPGALFTKNQKYHEACAGIVPADIDDLPDLIADDRLLVDRLDLLTQWKEAGLSTLKDVLDHGAPYAAQVDQRTPIHWAMATAATGNPGTTSDWLRQSLCLKENTYGQLVQVICNQIQSAFGHASSKPVTVGESVPMVDIVIDAQAEKFTDGPLPAAPPAPAIPKKRRVMVEEEGEII